MDQFEAASLHEAAHLVVARVLGRTGALYLFRDGPGAAWAGRVVLDDDNIQPDDRIVIGLAGLASEERLQSRRGMPVEKAFHEIQLQRLHGGFLLSPADLAAADGAELHHVERAFELVERYADMIRSAARLARERARSEPGESGSWPPA